MFGGFASSREAKSASRSEAPSTSHSERATFAFMEIQLQWLESVGHFTPSDEAKALLCREFQCPKILSEPLSLFVYICYNSKIEEGRYMPKGSGKVIAQNKKLFMIISSKKHTKQGLSFKERKLSRFALDA